jgi:hypothetical protein
MTNLEAIQSTVAGYPLSENTFKKALTDRGLLATDNYPGKSKAFELATADVYSILATAANISEGGFSVSVSERSNFLKMADKIYGKWGENTGSANSISDATARW